jgi:hypothetical protein
MSQLSYSALKDRINQLIIENTLQQVSGTILNSILNDIVDSTSPDTIGFEYGPGTPSVNLGNDGWVYFQTNGTLYKKVSGVWTSIGSFTGQVGPPGAMLKSTSNDTVVLPVTTSLQSNTLAAPHNQFSIYAKCESVDVTLTMYQNSTQVARFTIGAGCAFTSPVMTSSVDNIKWVGSNGTIDTADIIIINMSTMQ